MFTEFSKAVHARFVEMSKGELFVVEPENLFERYLEAYPEGTNPIFRTRTVHDCQCCKLFIRRLGIVVSIKNGKLITVWGGHTLPEPYDHVAEMMDAIIRSSPIVSVFRTEEKGYGIEYNYDNATNERHDHFYGVVAAKHYAPRDADTKRGEQNAIYQVLRRGLEEIEESDLRGVIDLIESNMLYRGQEHLDSVRGFFNLLKRYEASNRSDLFIWEHLGDRHARFRNTVIGTLLVDLSEGVDIEQAVKSFENKVAPTNYKRTTSIITQRMVEDAVETLNKLGLGGAIHRRYARLSDVSVNDVLFVDNSTRVKMKDGVAAILESSVKKSTPDVKKSIKITSEAFIRDVLPTAKTVEAFIENRHTGNFVSLTGSDGPEKLFKWNNNFAWSYDGEVADSVKQRVKAAGGNINAKLRVSLSWFNTDDLDLHAHTPFGHVWYGHKQGILDVDMNVSNVVRNPVENLAFNLLRDGDYKIEVNQFRRRETTDFGFALEVEHAGVLNQYSYPKAVQGTVACLNLKVKGGQLVGIESSLKGGNTSQEKWGVKTETLVPVTAVMYSPNHWGDQKVGAKHLIFSLQNCKNPEATRGIYNEFLRSDLEKHRKVFEVLGARTKCQPADDQISGVGFTAARGDTVTVVVDGRKSYTLSF